MDFAPDTYAIIGTIIAVGFTVVGMGWRMASRLDRRIAEDRAAADADRRELQRSMDAFRQAADADRRAAQTAAAADRQAAQAAADADRRELQRSMDAFQQQMLRLAERQSRLEGRRDAGE